MPAARCAGAAFALAALSLCLSGPAEALEVNLIPKGKGKRSGDPVSIPGFPAPDASTVSGGVGVFSYLPTWLATADAVYFEFPGSVEEDTRIELRADGATTRRGVEVLARKNPPPPPPPAGCGGYFAVLVYDCTGCSEALDGGLPAILTDAGFTKAANTARFTVSATGGWGHRLSIYIKEITTDGYVSLPTTTTLGPAGVFASPCVAPIEEPPVGTPAPPNEGPSNPLGCSDFCLDGLFFR